MATDEAFHTWARNFERLSEAQILKLPAWQQPIAFSYPFILSTLGDGAGSLFYNHPENIENVAKSFDEIDETDLAARIRRIEAILEPLLEIGPQDAVAEACL